MLGFSPEWVLKCIGNLDDQANNLEHLGQEWGVLPEWTLKCVCKLEESIEIFIHRELGNCFSPVVITESSLQLVDSLQIPELMWRLSTSDLENNFLHFKQVNGFSPEWVLTWERKLEDWENDFVQWGQAWGFSPVWTLICICSAW
jgi:hypothetical protein